MSTPTLPLAMKLSRHARRASRGFSLVEVALALGIISFALLSLVGLLPTGFANFRKAMNNTIESQIVQSISNDLVLQNFSSLKTYADNSASAPAYYFDNEGSPVTKDAAWIYKATLTFEAVDHANSPVTFHNTSATSNAPAVCAYNVVIKIVSSVDGSANANAPRRYPFLVSNSGL